MKYEMVMMTLVNLKDYPLDCHNLCYPIRISSLSCGSRLVSSLDNRSCAGPSR